MTPEQSERPRLVYGPVPSRRLGQSLGVDPIPFKTCNYNCVYCQLGRTRPLTNQRKDFFPREAILGQVVDALKAHKPGEIDYVTFVGQGEPLLCASLGWLIRRVKDITPLSVAVITNGALLFQPGIRDELAPADVVIPTLDAADQETFRRINRPWPHFRIAEIVEGMARFRQAFSGQVWMEVMLVRGLNDREEVLLPLRDALARIAPQRVQINVPVRPPAESWVEIPDQEGITRALAILGEAVEVVGPYEGAFDLSGAESLMEAILAIIRRHPMREQRLVETLSHYSPGDVQATLTSLEASGQARRRRYRGQMFWQYAEGAFAPDKERSQG